MSNGSAFPLTASSLTTTSETPFIPGRSNIEFNKIPSKYRSLITILTDNSKMSKEELSNLCKEFGLI